MHVHVIKFTTGRFNDAAQMSNVDVHFLLDLNVEVVKGSLVLALNFLGVYFIIFVLATPLSLIPLFSWFLKTIDHLLFGLLLLLHLHLWFDASEVAIVHFEWDCEHMLVVNINVEVFLADFDVITSWEGLGLLMAIRLHGLLLLMWCHLTWTQLPCILKPWAHFVFGCSRYRVIILVISFIIRWRYRVRIWNQSLIVYFKVFWHVFLLLHLSLVHVNFFWIRLCISMFDLLNYIDIGFPLDPI